MELKESLKELVFNKSELKQHVYQATKEAFELFREQTRDLILLFKERSRAEGKEVAFEFTDRGDFEFDERVQKEAAGIVRKTGGMITEKGVVG